MKKRILVLHGVNLNLLGEREPKIYGTLTLKEMNAALKKEAASREATLKIFQSNSESGLVNLLHRYRKWADGVVINPGAFTHYSYAIRDAVAAIVVPTVEVHLSDPVARADMNPEDEFRRISVIAPVCVYRVAGKGWKSYVEGIDYLCRI